MADYSGAYEMNCEYRCDRITGHAPFCPSNPHYKQWQNGFAYDEENRMWKCRRGCGCYVHDTALHSLNVCVDWDG